VAIEVYLIHFNKPYKHAGHYLGKTRIGHRNRTSQHHVSPGPLIKAAKENGSSFVVSRIWRNAAADYERRLKNRGGMTKNCPYCRKGNMGEFLSVKRQLWMGIKSGCKWCGAKKKRMFTYNGDGPFCNKKCCKSHWGTWPYEIGFNRELPIEYVNGG
jgi:hypothetical protein